MLVTARKFLWRIFLAVLMTMAVFFALGTSAWAISDPDDQSVFEEQLQEFVDPATEVDLSNLYLNFSLGDKSWSGIWEYGEDMPGFLPLRSLVNLAGGSLEWKNDPGVAFFSMGNKTFAVCNKVKYIYVGQRTENGVSWQKFYYAQPGKVLDGSTYLNLDALPHLGMSHAYIEEMHQLNISLNSEMYNSSYKAPTADELWALIGDDLKNNIPKSVTIYLGAKTTYFNPANTNRTTNLRLAVKAIDGAAVAPGEVFSFNKTVGPRTPGRGYKEAIIFQQGTEQVGYGGGVCQVSSTLYNAVLASRLQVVERHPHSLPVAYVSPDMDASVYYGSADFRFKNTTKGTVIIRANISNNWLQISLYCRT